MVLRIIEEDRDSSYQRDLLYLWGGIDVSPRLDAHRSRPWAHLISVELRVPLQSVPTSASRDSNQSIPSFHPPYTPSLLNSSGERWCPWFQIPTLLLFSKWTTHCDTLIFEHCRVSSIFFHHIVLSRMEKFTKTWNIWFSTFGGETISI